METDAVIIDVREPFEYASGHIDGALNIPLPTLTPDTPQLDDIPKDTPLILYCRTGRRSAAAIQILQNLGYTNLTNGINKDQVEAFLK
jgi:phage shock protein E